MIWPFSRKKKPQTTEITATSAPADYDPLDPHGDGTLRPGDPVFEAAMRGETMIGNRGPDGWTFKEVQQ